MSTTEQAPQGEITRSTANDRFKQQFPSWFWGSLCLAVVVHFALMAFWPQMSAADMRTTTDEFEAIELPPEIEIPPPPEPIARPATPVISDAVIDDDITIAETTFEANLIEDLPPPPTATTDLSAAPVFTPMTVRPELQNRTEVERAMVRFYPNLLRDAGIGGTALFWFFINEDGRVVRYDLKQTSGHEALDKAAENVANIMHFSPAWNRDRKVPVWIEIPITFRAR
jgi:periplasmic protein TonB